MPWEVLQRVPGVDILLNSEATCCCDVTEDAWRGGESTDPWAAAPAPFSSARPRQIQYDIEP